MPWQGGGEESENIIESICDPSQTSISYLHTPVLLIWLVILPSSTTEKKKKKQHQEMRDKMVLRTCRKIWDTSTPVFLSRSPFHFPPLSLSL
jgi:hypothetical protein